jgi:hypothetical protein
MVADERTFAYTAVCGGCPSQIIWQFLDALYKACGAQFGQEQDRGERPNKSEGAQPDGMLRASHVRAPSPLTKPGALVSLGRGRLPLCRTTPDRASCALLAREGTL